MLISAIFHCPRFVVLTDTRSLHRSEKSSPSRIMGFRAVKLVLVIFALCSVGYAHFALLLPPSALAIEDGGKGAPPCAEGPESKVVTAVQGGHPLKIKLSEFVFHPG